MRLNRVLVAAALLASMTTVGAQVGKGLIDPNTADEKTLLGVPNLTAPIVKGILERRPFASQTDFNAFLTSQGLGKEQLTQTYGKTFVHLNLNTATREEILMIPNLGNRMVREFLEYRPYKAMAQFRREMGKYVDKTEVARLERYVVVD
jgi:DNA uptake protein ComE-like DNA-binding protein